MILITSRKFLFVIFSYFFVSVCRCQVNVSDSFETTGLSKIWSMDRMEPNSFRMQSDIVRSGHSAIAIMVRPNDKFEAGIGKSLSSERDELLEAERLISLENRTYEYRFSMFLPDSFPIVPVRLVIAQWKQVCPRGGICNDDSPVMAIRYIGGKLYITLQNDSAQKRLFQTTEEMRNKWLDFIFKIRFSTSTSGQIDAWLNGQQIVSYRGVTAYSDKRGYTQKNYFYFKMGLYRDLMKEPMTIYIDDYSKRQLGE